MSKKKSIFQLFFSCPKKSPKKTNFPKIGPFGPVFLCFLSKKKSKIAFSLTSKILVQKKVQKKIRRFAPTFFWTFFWPDLAKKTLFSFWPRVRNFRFNQDLPAYRFIPTDTNWARMGTNILGLGTNGNECSGFGHEWERMLWI